MSKDMLGLALRDARGPLTTLLERLSGTDGDEWLKRLNKFNRGENPFGNPFFTVEVVSRGWLGEICLREIGYLGAEITSRARHFLENPQLKDPCFTSTEGVAYKLGVISGEEFKETGFHTNHVAKKGRERGWYPATIEIGLLLLIGLLNGTVDSSPFEGLSEVVIMHHPNSNSPGESTLLSIRLLEDGKYQLGVQYAHPGLIWNTKRVGFVFLEDQRPQGFVKTLTNRMVDSIFRRR